MRQLVIIGGGEHARSVAWAAASAAHGWLAGFLDPDEIARTVEVAAAPRLGDDSQIAVLRAAHDFVLGVGTIGVSPARRRIVERVTAEGARFVAVIHPTACVAPSAIVAPGAVVLARAIVGPGARIGAHAVVNTGAIVEHDCEIGDFAQVAPGAVLGGGVRVGGDAFIGLGARIRDHVTIGARALVAMAAAVVADVGDDAVVIGIPARERGRDA